jgi:hypothetical protein
LPLGFFFQEETGAKPSGYYTLSLQLVVPGQAKNLFSEAPLSQQLCVILYIPGMEFGGHGHFTLGKRNRQM